MAKIAFPNRGDVPADLSVILDQMPAMAPVDMMAHSPVLAALAFCSRTDHGCDSVPLFGA
jgi:hypothetical protein